MKMKFKISFNAPIVLSFILICFIVTILGCITNGKIVENLFMCYHSSLTNPLTYLRLFTHVFGHSGWEHFIGNATYLLLLGPILEEKYGSLRIAEIIAVTAFAGGIVNYLFFWNTAVCGASGIVFAFILLVSFTGFRTKEIPFSFILVAIIFIGNQIYEGFTYNDNIAHIQHIIGGLIGAGMGYKLNKNRQ